MSRSSAAVRPVSPAHAYLYSAACLGLAGAGLASARVVEALLLIAGVVAYVALAATRSR